MTGQGPVCVDTQLAPKLREGVEIEGCPSFRGVWLDRGELEKLLARAAGELTHYRSRDSEPPSSRRGYSKQGRTASEAYWSRSGTSLTEAVRAPLSEIPS